MHVSKTEAYVFAFALILAPICVLIYGQMRHATAKMPESKGGIATRLNPEPRTYVLPGVRPEEVIGHKPAFRGNIKSRFTLVEFGDYQCPPCRRMHSSIIDILTKHPGKVRFVFRNLPLTSVHPQALSAAFLAEEA